MKVQIFIQIAVMLSATCTFALPVTNITPPVEDTQSGECSRDYQDSYRDLIHHTSFMGKDDRKVLSKNLEVVKFSAAEQEQALRCSGEIFCPGGNDGLGSQQSGGSICPVGARSSGGHCSADRIATVAHLFVDRKTNRFIPKLETCEFRNYRGHVSKLEIKDLKSIDPTVDSKNPHKNMRSDKIVIHLKKPIPGCDPYDIADASDVPERTTEVIALTNTQEDQAGTVDGSEPQAYACNVTRSFAAKEGSAGIFYSDCDVNPGGSGGFALVRKKDNRLSLAGMFIRIGAMELNGQAYDESKKNYTIAVGTNADFVRMAANPGKQPDTAPSRIDASNLRPASSGK